MRPRQVIERTRDGLPLDETDLRRFLDGYLRGETPEYLVSAWLMAVYFRGLSEQTTSALTRALLESGAMMPPSAPGVFRLDKHSTGGVGDKTSLLLVPWVSAVCRRLFGEGKVAIPMVSGRGLGHSGGTLDKLESVEGFRTRIALSEARRLLERNGFFMLGQTEEIAPLDRKLYALRDCTGTVESIPLIVSSILGKKLAERLDGLVLDLKHGDGAFMRNAAAAKALGRELLRVARLFGLSAVGVLTRMDEPLGRAVGHSLEIEECDAFFRGAERDGGLLEVTLALASRMVALAGRGRVDSAAASDACLRELGGPEPLRLFRTMLEAQGGDYDGFFESRERERQQLLKCVARAPRGGYVWRVGARAIGALVAEIGGGRAKVTDSIDPEVGAWIHRKVGDSVDGGEPVVTVYYRRPADGDRIERALADAIEIGVEPPARPAWVTEVLESEERGNE